MAKLARVSFITVSRVVNGENNVKPQTRERVLAAIKELGYIPCFAGKALNTGRNDTIGVVIPCRINDDQESLMIVRAFNGIVKACHAHKTDFLVTVVDPDDASDNYLLPYKQRKADGLIYLGIKPMSQALADEIAKHRILCVAIAARPANEWISWIDSDDYAAEYETESRIIDKGQPLAEMGYQGTAMLIDLIKSGGKARRTELLPLASLV